jgi:2-oxoisovalerate dehydrogenase E1 component
MSDLKVLRLVKKGEGDQPEKAFTAEAVPTSEPRPATVPAIKPVIPPPIRSVPVRGKQQQRQQPKPTLSREQMLKIFRTMYLSRRLDDKEIQMKGQNRIFFQISGAGHEAILVAAGMCLRPGYDWFYPYYRDRALCLQLGMTPLEQLLQSVGAEADPASHGRQMPSHWGHKKLNIVSQSSPTGTQLLQAVGCAEAAYRVRLIKELKKRIDGFHNDEVAYVSLGDGTTSEGEFWEALNTACNLKLPVLFLLEDNGYAISVPVEVQTAGGDVSKLIEGFPNLYRQRCDGTDAIESFATMQRAVDNCRKGRGPSFVHAKVIRPYSHSLSDDEKLYRCEAERVSDAEHDPIKRFGSLLVQEGIATQDELQQLKDEIDRETNEAADIALASSQPAPETALDFIYSPTVDPTSPKFDTEDRVELSGNPGTMVDLINRCLHTEMKRDPRIVVFGEDIADCSREEALGQVKGKGGVFKLTHGLQRLFGDDRVFVEKSSLAGRNKLQIFSFDRLRARGGHNVDYGLAEHRRATDPEIILGGAVNEQISQIRNAFHNDRRRHILDPPQRDRRCLEHLAARCLTGSSWYGTAPRPGTPRGGSRSRATRPTRPWWSSGRASRS